MLQKLGEQLKNKPTVGGRARRWVGSIGIAFAVGIAYFLAARLGLAFLTDPERVAVCLLSSLVRPKGWAGS